MKRDKDVGFAVLKDHFGENNVVEADGITWCQDPKIVDRVVESIQYGNEPSGCDIYQAAAFLVNVPEFSSQRARKRGSVTTTLYSFKLIKRLRK